MKRVLIVHPSYPGQFRGLVEYLGVKGIEIWFVAEKKSGYVQKPISSVKVINAKGNKKIVEDKKKDELSNMLRRAIEYGNTYEKIRESGWKPDIIICHSGWGSGTLLRKYFKHIPIVSYFEWYFGKNRDYWPNDDRYFRSSVLFSAESIMRNIYISHELVEADLVVTPTMWQKKQAPSCCLNKLEVLHEGVSTRDFTPNKNTDSTVRLSYTARGLEAVRGFQTLVKALKYIARYTSKKWILDIIGAEEMFYGGNTRYEEYIEEMRRICMPYVESGHVRMRGKLDFQDYKMVINSSDVHIYISKPYVPSWSLIEAMASGCYIVYCGKSMVDSIVNTDGSSRLEEGTAKELGLVVGTLIEKRSKQEINRWGYLQRRKVYDKYDKDKCNVSWEKILNRLTSGGLRIE